MNDNEDNDQDIAMRRAIRGYWRSHSARTHNRLKPNIWMSIVTATELWAGCWEYKVTLRAEDGTELRHTRFLKIDNEWSTVK